MDVLIEQAEDFFSRIAGIGVAADAGFVRVAALRVESGVQILGLLLQVGPDVLRSPTKAHLTDMTLAFQFALVEVNLAPAEFVRKLIDGVLVTPLGTYGLSRPRDKLENHTGKIDDAAAIGQGQRWITFDIGSISDTPVETDTVNWKLRAQPEPYDGLQDLLNTFGVNGLGYQVRVVMSALAGNPARAN